MLTIMMITLIQINDDDNNNDNHYRLSCLNKTNIIIIIITPGLHNKIPPHKIFTRVWVAQKSFLFIGSG